MSPEQCFLRQPLHFLRLALDKFSKAIIRALQEILKLIIYTIRERFLLLES